MTAALPELARDRLPILEAAYLDVLVEYAGALDDPRATSPLWPPRQILEARLCAIEQAHDAALVTATHNMAAGGYLRRTRDELLGTQTLRGRRQRARPAAREATDYEAIARLVRGKRRIAGITLGE